MCQFTSLLTEHFDYLRDCLTTWSNCGGCELTRVCLAYLINWRGCLRKNRDQPEVIGRTQGLKTTNSEDKFIYWCKILLYVLLKAVIFNRTQVICGVICALFKVISQFFYCTYLLWNYQHLKNWGFPVWADFWRKVKRPLDLANRCKWTIFWKGVFS